MATLAEQQAYLNRMLPLAEHAAKRLNTNPLPIVGQLALETNWGKSVLPGSFNHGNIMETRKGVQGVWANDNGNRRQFRKFTSDADFMNHYIGLLERRYKGVIGAPTALAFGQALKAGGYAEDPAYVNSIVKMNNTVQKALGGKYVWNGVPSSPEALTQGEATMMAMAGAGGVSGAGGELPGATITPIQAPDGTPQKQQPTVLDIQSNSGEVQEQVPNYQPSTMGLETLNRLFGGGKYSNSSWRK